jgi:hypothetical protein
VPTGNSIALALKNHTMPSLIYITRIRPLSAELAHGLESSGFHVKSFGPGEITADECLLVMTSEAVLAGLQASGLASESGAGAARDAQSQASPPLQDIQKHLGAEAAVWNCIKAAALSESAVGELKAASGQQSSTVPTVVAAADDNLGFVPSQAWLRVLAPSQQKAAAPQVVPAAQERAWKNSDNSGVPLLSVPPIGRASSEPGRASTLSLKKTGFSNGIRSENGQARKRFWHAGAMAAVLLIFAVVLLAGRASILPSTPDGAAIDPRSQTSNRSGTSIKGPNPAEARRHKSDYDFVAEDYTTHFDLQGHRRASLQAPDLRRGAQNRLIPKRVVVN